MDVPHAGHEDVREYRAILCHSSVRLIENKASTAAHNRAKLLLRVRDHYGSGIEGRASWKTVDGCFLGVFERRRLVSRSDGVVGVRVV